MAGSGKHHADEALAVHLAAGLSIKDAAERTGVGERTLRRRLEHQEFRKRVEDLKADAVGRAVAVLADRMAAAASKLAALVNSPDEKIALAAARTVLETGLKLRQAEEIEKRVQDLTERINALTATEPDHDRQRD